MPKARLPSALAEQLPLARNLAKTILVQYTSLSLLVLPVQGLKCAFEELPRSVLGRKKSDVSRSICIYFAQRFQDTSMFCVGGGVPVELSRIIEP